MAAEENLFMCRNHKVGTSTYISTTFMQLSEMRKVNRTLLASLFRGNKDNMKELKNKNYVSFVVNTDITIFTR